MKINNTHIFLYRAKNVEMYNNITPHFIIGVFKFMENEILL